jgi:hypothetical protein
MKFVYFESLMIIDGVGLGIKLIYSLYQLIGILRLLFLTASKKLRLTSKFLRNSSWLNNE